jgi:hypothetical protein
MMAIAGGALLALDRAVLLPQGRRQHKRNFRKLATPAVR